MPCLMKIHSRACDLCVHRVDSIFAHYDLGLRSHDHEILKISSTHNRQHLCKAESKYTQRFDLYSVNKIIQPSIYCDLDL